MEIGLHFLLAGALFGNIGEKAFFRLIPVDQSQRLVFLVLRHEGAEESDDLAHQLSRDLRQSRGKPGSDLRKIHYIIFGGDKLALLHLAKLIDPAVTGGNQADDLIRRPRLFQRTEFALISGVALSLHLHLGLHIAAGIFFF